MTAQKRLMIGQRRLVAKWVPLAVRLAKSHKFLPYEEAVSSAFEGLTRAALTWDRNRAAFPTYAKFKIMGQWSLEIRKRIRADKEIHWQDTHLVTLTPTTPPDYSRPTKTILRMVRRLAGHSQWKLLRLYVLKGMKPIQIARQMGVTRQAIHERLRKIKQRLQKEPEIQQLFEEAFN